jgi:hypothetical protein
MKVEEGKEYVTYGKQLKTRIFALDGIEPYCVMGAIYWPDLGWCQHSWRLDGKSSQVSTCDLMEAKPVKRKLYVEVYENGNFYVNEKPWFCYLGDYETQNAPLRTYPIEVDFSPVQDKDDDRNC